MYKTSDILICWGMKKLFLFGSGDSLLLSTSHQELQTNEVGAGRDRQTHHWAIWSYTAPCGVEARCPGSGKWRDPVPESPWLWRRTAPRRPSEEPWNCAGDCRGSGPCHWSDHGSRSGYSTAGEERRDETNYPPWKPEISWARLANDTRVMNSLGLRTSRDRGVHSDSDGNTLRCTWQEEPPINHPSRLPSSCQNSHHYTPPETAIRWLYVGPTGHAWALQTFHINKENFNIERNRNHN